jgi:hypothetical protein
VSSFYGLVISSWFCSFGNIIDLNGSKRFLCEYIGGEFGWFLSKLYKFTTNNLFSMCLFSYRHNEVRRKTNEWFSLIKNRGSMTLNSVGTYKKEEFSIPLFWHTRDLSLLFSFCIFLINIFKIFCFIWTSDHVSSEIKKNCIINSL